MLLAASVQNYESRVNLYHNIFQYCLVLAILFLIIAVVLFIVLKIPRVFGEMTGRDARKAIEEMTADNKTGALGATGKIGDDGRRQRKKEKSGSLGSGRLRKSGSQNQERFYDNGGMSTDHLVTGTESIGRQDMDVSEEGSYKTSPLHRESQETDLLDTGNSATGVLDDGRNATSVLDSGAGETSILESGSDETSLLSHGYDTYMEPKSETMVLTQNMRGGTAKQDFVILRSVVEIHTQEVI